MDSRLSWEMLACNYRLQGRLREISLFNKSNSRTLLYILTLEYEINWLIEDAPYLAHSGISL